ncbi:hypothetical protein [Parafrankia sp. BMG5.11]|uniref:hypothetical protein n=1 Tax=Parafrankia sp. BMG5.11 TaxID=222540 RepID=UPI00103D7BCC|nr:hypothetical protein [Parafrankia sp. BMG5.11]TCJ32983.1 hypothetical protein E0504_40205 [Parafrankia sp. BMG5.11]
MTSTAQSHAALAEWIGNNPQVDEPGVPVSGCRRPDQFQRRSGIPSSRDLAFERLTPTGMAIIAAARQAPCPKAVDLIDRGGPIDLPIS